MLRTIPFSNFDKWYVSYYINPFVIKSNYQLVNLSEIISPRKEKISKNNYKNDISVIKKISFSDGKIYLRDENKTGMDLYKISKDELLVSKINFHQGAVSINKYGELVCSTHYQPYSVNNKIVNLDYLTLALRSDNFLNFVKYLKAEGIKNESTYEFIENLEIPLPPLTEQNRIVETYNAKMNVAKQQETQAQQLEQNIENYLFEALGIEKIQKKIKIKKLSFVRFQFLDIWGVDRLLRGSFTQGLESKTYPNQKLGALVDINPRTDLKDLKDDDKMSFIPMKNISDDYGIVTQKDKGQKSNSKGYTKFQDGDLIWARITPCMQNGKSAIVSDLDNGIGYGSTEYHVLREKNKNYSIEFVYHLLRSDVVLNDAVNHFTGSAGQQRVPKLYLENLIVPVPPLEIQKQIANHVLSLKKQIKNLKAQSEQNREQAIKNFEKEIFS